MAIRRGDIIELGPHRLMCGDCTDTDEVKHLFGDRRASTIFFSPPYVERRKYNEPLTKTGADLFVSSLDVAPCTPAVQIFVVVGNLHRNNEQDLYYEPWIAAAQKSGWRRFSQYVWDKQHGLPGYWSGRLSPCFEWIFHLNKRSSPPNKVVECKWGQGRHHRNYRLSKGNTIKNSNGKYQRVSDFKAPDSILRVNPSGRAAGVGHPAVFPVELAQKVISAFRQDIGAVYDPMVGSGSTILAADCLGQASLACELSPHYCQIAVDRYWRHKDKQAKEQARGD